jgi:protein ImuA
VGGLQTSSSLAELRARIERLENRPSLAEALILGDSPADLLRAPAGLLHEIYADSRRDAAASLGFALGQARGLLTPQRRALIVVQLMHETQDMGVPYGPGLKSFGVEPDTVVLGRVANITEFLWAIEEAVTCQAVAAVIADVAGHHKALDFTASRRLSLRAASTGASMFLLRYGLEREATAARLRWHMAPVLSAETMFDARAPAGPRFRILLEKGRLAGDRRSAGIDLLVDWTKDGFVMVGSSTERRRVRRQAGAPVSGALSAALGDRLPKAG